MLINKVMFGQRNLTFQVLSIAQIRPYSQNSDSSSFSGQLDLSKSWRHDTN